jgi:hypothetical protein
LPCQVRHLSNRMILRWDAGAVVDDFHNSLIVIASGLDSDLTSAIHRIRCVIEQVDPYLREFASDSRAHDQIRSFPSGNRKRHLGSATAQMKHYYDFGTRSATSEAL